MMKSPFARALMLLPLALLVVFLPTCTGGETNPNQAALTAPEATPASVSPTPTFTPEPPPPTPSPTPDRAVLLLREVQEKHQEVKSARGTMEIVLEGQAGRQQPATIAVDFEIAGPDIHMKLSGSQLPFGPEAEFIAKGEMTYLKMRDQWIALPASGRREITPQTDLVNIDVLHSHLINASGAKVVGRRSVKGIECDVISFELSPEKMRELAALRGHVSAQRAMDEDVQIERFQGEAVVGTADKILRQMVFKISGYEKQKPDERFALSLTTSLWDINSVDIVIREPEGVTPLTIPIPPSPTPVPTPVARFISASKTDAKPKIDGLISPTDGWDKAEAVRGPYADGAIEIKALHDGTNLYLLLVWDEARYTKAEGLYLLFEDGGSAPQGKLDGKNDDCKYVGVSGLPDGYRDAAWSSPGWRVGEATHGSASGRHSSGKMVVEWSGPLNSGTNEDISVSGKETLGFAVVNWSDGRAGSRGAWPIGAGVYDAGTWGRLTVD